MKACKTCGGLVLWVKIQGRWHCHNKDGSDHWDLCSKRKWQQVKETGERFENVKPDRDTIISGYRNSIHGTKLSRDARRAVKGDQYQRSPECKDCAPPWEVCNPCPNNLKELPLEQCHPASD